ncbi:uncharacterized protein LOC116338681 [Contarinia nasturtii]|uniref:uncharacterized protein LOC116338681 n=1 Tax=Contarinia nasturtii TaxID=265458 RepID=UPI0012D393A3|nr:uncharacterized protein LOC116338681 [Contarinia nasturtii]
MTTRSRSIIMEIILIFCSLVVFFGDSTTAQNPCITPNQEEGKCVPLRQCDELYKLLSLTLNNDQLELLRKSQCATIGRNPYVCCSNSPPPPSASESDFPPPGQCGTQFKERIIGGEETDIGEYPWMALLKYTKLNGQGGGYYCGGAIIHKDYVVTAAHCIRGSSLIKNRFKLTSIRLGEHNLQSEKDCAEISNECADPVKDVLVAEEIVHENYASESSQQAHDIALIRLAESIHFTDWIRPICLPFASYLRNKNFDDSTVVVVGFGKTENASRSEIKMKLEMKGFNLNRCNNVYKLAGITLADHQLCAGGEQGRDSCSGDSGGPLLADDLLNKANPYSYLVGVVSFGPKICGTPGFPGVYTRIDKHLDWILSHELVKVMNQIAMAGHAGAASGGFVEIREQAIKTHFMFLHTLAGRIRVAKIASYPYQLPEDEEELAEGGAPAEKVARMTIDEEDEGSEPQHDEPEADDEGEADMVHQMDETFGGFQPPGASSPAQPGGSSEDMGVEQTSRPVFKSQRGPDRNIMLDVQPTPVSSSTPSGSVAQLPATTSGIGGKRKRKDSPLLLHRRRSTGDSKEVATRVLKTIFQNMRIFNKKDELKNLRNWTICTIDCKGKSAHQAGTFTLFGTRRTQATECPVLYRNCLLSLIITSNLAKNPCTTPDQKNGVCISLQQCPPALKIVKNYHTSTRSQIDSVRQAQCGSVGNTPLVCCEEPTFKESDFPQPGQCGTQLKVRIIGGTETTITDYPWMALIEYTKNGQKRFLCGGSLINKDYILTAAHCISATKLVQSGWKPTSVRLGEHDLSTERDCEDRDCAPPVVNVDIGEINVHEAYEPSSSTQYHDIALIRLSRSVEFTEFIKPVCLPFAPNLRDANLDDVSLSVSGFGRTENGTSSDVKLKLDINGFNWDRCNNLYGRRLVHQQLCAGGIEGKDSCSGDSGGPLMRDVKLMRTLPVTYLAGIVSRGHRHCGTVGYPAIYTRVDEFLYWIRHHMKHF